MLLAYVRHFWITQAGPTTERELGERIETAIQGERQSVELVNTLETSSTDYVALLAPTDHPRWSKFHRHAQQAIAIIAARIDAD